MRRAIGLPFLTLMLFGFVSLTPEEIECEHAAVVLEDCCPEVDFTRLTCVADHGCSADVIPAFDEDTSACLQDLSCSEMRALDEYGRSICERVDVALQEREEDYDALGYDDELGPVEGVCP